MYGLFRIWLSFNIKLLINHTLFISIVNLIIDFLWINLLLLVNTLLHLYVYYFLYWIAKIWWKHRIYNLYSFFKLLITIFKMLAWFRYILQFLLWNAFTWMFLMYWTLRWMKNCSHVYAWIRRSENVVIFYFLLFNGFEMIHK